MIVREIGTGNSVAAGATVANNASPFLEGKSVAIVRHSRTGAFVGTAVLQDSDDGVAWAAVAGTSASDAGVVIHQAVLRRFIRINTTAFTSGSVTFTMLAE